MRKLEERLLKKYNHHSLLVSGGGEERSTDEICKNACRELVFEASKKNLVKAVAKCTDMENLVNRISSIQKKHKKPETLATNGF